MNKQVLQLCFSGKRPLRILLFLFGILTISLTQPEGGNAQKRLDKSCENGVCYREEDQGPCIPNNDEPRLYRWEPIEVCCQKWYPFIEIVTEKELEPEVTAEHYTEIGFALWGLASYVLLPWYLWSTWSIDFDILVMCGPVKEHSALYYLHLYYFHTTKRRRHFDWRKRKSNFSSRVPVKITKNLSAGSPHCTGVTGSEM